MSDPAIKCASMSRSIAYDNGRVTLLSSSASPSSTGRALGRPHWCEQGRPLLRPPAVNQPAAVLGREAAQSVAVGVARVRADGRALGTRQTSGGGRLTTRGAAGRPVHTRQSRRTRRGYWPPGTGLVVRWPVESAVFAGVLHDFVRFPCHFPYRLGRHNRPDFRLFAGSPLRRSP